MMGGLVEIASLSFLSLMVITWLGVVLLLPRKSPSDLPPDVRNLRARLWLYAPLWLPMILVGTAVMAGALGQLVGIQDHCLAQANHSHHLCVIHPPHASTRDLASWSVIATLLSISVIGIRTLRPRILGWRWAKCLTESSTPSSLGKDVRYLEIEAPLAMTVGIVRPLIVVSRGLVNALSRESLDIVLLHEREHIRRRDTYWAMLDSFLAGWLPTFQRHLLLDELHLAREQACDLRAAAQLGKPRVAKALVEVARLNLAHPLGVGLSIAGSSLERRITSLLNPVRPTPGWTALLPYLGMTLLALGVGPFHFLLEEIFTYFLH